MPSLYPFCSSRCQSVDLGNWLLGKYAIERDVTDEDVPEASKSSGELEIDADGGAG